MNIRLLAIITISITLLFSAIQAAFATDPSEMIAIVDMQRVLRDAKAIKSVDKQMKKIRDKYQTEITQQEESLRKEDKKLSEQHSILSAEAFTEKEKAFKKKLAKVQRDIQEKRASLDNAFRQAINLVQERVYKIIASLAKIRGFKVAVPSSQTLYVDTSLDITSSVIKQLDKELPDVTVKLKK